MLTLAGLLQLLINGILVGLSYALIGLGFTLVFGVMRMLNLLHGSAYAWAAFLVFVGANLIGIPYWLAVVLAVAALAPMAALVERLILRSLVGNEFASLVVTLGLFISLEGLALLVFGPDPLPIRPPLQGVLVVGGVRVSSMRALVAGIALLAIIALWFTLRRTDLGRAMRAVAEAPEIAALMGISRGRIYFASYVIGMTLAALAGATLAPAFSVTPSIGLTPLVKSFIVVIIGGLGNVPGAVVAGLGLGLLESGSGFLVGTARTGQIVFVIIILTLLWRPEGILAGGTGRR